MGRTLRLNAAEFAAWVGNYNAAGIDGECPPPSVAVEQAGRCALVVCSHLPRSLESAKALGIERVALCDPLFREMEMPRPTWRSPRLPLPAWAALCRLAWAFGYSADAESFGVAKERAHECAKRLAGLALANGSVLFVGHGSLNWFIARYLKRMGWEGGGRPAGRYWEFGVFLPAADKAVPPGH